jgi:hypothetical protein
MRQMKTQKMVMIEPMNKELTDGKTAEIIMFFLGLFLGNYFYFKTQNVILV